MTSRTISNAVHVIPTTNIIEFKSQNFRYTQDHVFVIKNFDSEILYIRDDYINNIHYSPLLNLIRNNFIVLVQSNVKLFKSLNFTYNKYKFYRTLQDKRKFKKIKNYYDYTIHTNDDDDVINENDCLKFGECLTTVHETNNFNWFNDIIVQPTNEPVLQSKITKNPFGEGNRENINILKNLSDREKNNNAIPLEGETYAIVRKNELVQNVSPYHIAFVLYTHLGVNITLEANADHGNEYQPCFSLYDITPNGHTFHARYSVDNLYKNGITIVLEKRYNLDDVLKIIRSEINNKNIQIKSLNTIRKTNKRKRSSSKNSLNSKNSKSSSKKSLNSISKRSKNTFSNTRKTKRLTTKKINIIKI